MDKLTKASCTLEGWLDTFSEVSEAFVDEGIKHTFIKMLIDPRKMGDIDVLIPGPLWLHGPYSSAAESKIDPPLSIPRVFLGSPMGVKINV